MAGAKHREEGSYLEEVDVSVRGASPVSLAVGVLGPGNTEAPSRGAVRGVTEKQRRGRPTGSPRARPSPLPPTAGASGRRGARLGPAQRPRAEAGLRGAASGRGAAGGFLPSAPTPTPTPGFALSIFGRERRLCWLGLIGESRGPSRQTKMLAFGIWWVHACSLTKVTLFRGRMRLRALLQQSTPNQVA